MWMPTGKGIPFKRRKKPDLECHQIFGANYLPQPDSTYIDPCVTFVNDLEVGHNSIQGYRTSMEDKHIIESLCEGHTLLAILDGHAGSESATIISNKYTSVLKATKGWKEYTRRLSLQTTSEGTRLSDSSATSTQSSIDDSDVSSEEFPADFPSTQNGSNVGTTKCKDKANLDKTRASDCGTDSSLDSKDGHHGMDSPDVDSDDQHSSEKGKSMPIAIPICGRKGTKRGGVVPPLPGLTPLSVTILDTVSFPPSEDTPSNTGSNPNVGGLGGPLSRLDDTAVLVRALHQSFVDMDQYLQADCADIAGISGSTCVVALVTPTTILTAHVGDSRCVLYDNGHIISMTHDHKPETDKERVRIEMAGGFVAMNRVNGELAMSRAMGDFQYKGNQTLPLHRQAVVAHPEIAIYPRANSIHHNHSAESTSPILQENTVNGREYPNKRNKGKISSSALSHTTKGSDSTSSNPKNDNHGDLLIILACDGVWDVLSNEDACEFVQSYYLNDFPLANMEDVCGALVDLSLSQGSTDNISAICGRLKKDNDNHSNPGSV